MVTEPGGSSTMRPKDGGFVIPADGSHALVPGGDHIVLMDLEQPLAVDPTRRGLPGRPAHPSRLWLPRVALSSSMASQPALARPRDARRSSGPSAAIGPPSCPLNTPCSFSACPSDALESMNTPTLQLPSAMTFGVSATTATTGPPTPVPATIAVGDVEDERHAVPVVICATCNVEVAWTEELA